MSPLTRKIRSSMSSAGLAPRMAPSLPPSPVPPPSRQPGVLHLVAEFCPYVRTGGLGEAVRGIADHQAGRGRETVVLLPLHRAVRARAPQLQPLGPPLQIVAPTGPERVQLFEEPHRDATMPRVLFAGHDASFDRPGVYGEGGDYADNHRRFSLLARVALQALPQLFETPPVLHLHDWHAALAAVLLRTEHAEHPFFGQVPSVLTVHNAGYQGHFTRDALSDLGLRTAQAALEWYGLLNLLQGGLRFADGVATVSPSHACELRTEDGGFGLHETFGALGERFTGILNGIDVEAWNPGCDPLIPCAYSVDDLTGKARCKADFQRRNGLAIDPAVPLFAMSARLVEQKGFDLVLGSKILARPDAQWAILGEGEPRYRDALAHWAAQAPQHVTCQFTFVEDYEHRLLAAADGLLMPSLYEPCGLTQMRAQRYGALPIVRRVGGLADTVEHGVTGFVFDRYAPDALAEAVGAAIRLHRERERWTARVREAMTRDFGWGGAVQRYDALYEGALARRQALSGTRGGAPQVERAAERAAARAVEREGRPVCVA